MRSLGVYWNDLREKMVKDLSLFDLFGIIGLFACPLYFSMSVFWFRCVMNESLSSM